MERSFKKLFFITLSVLLLGACGASDSKVIQFRAIGKFHTAYKLSTGAPRQGMLAPDSHGTIVLDTAMQGALHELNEFEYIWVLFHFNEVKGWEALVHPPESKHAFGLFATRSPRRPNPIGLSLIRLDSIVANVLYVSGIDAFDGTPVLDIKPYLPSVDVAPESRNEVTERALGHHDVDFISDSLVQDFVLGDSL